MCAQWHQRAIDSQARHEVLEIVEKKLDAALAAARPGDQITFSWSPCFNCECSHRINAAAASEMAELKKVASEKLSAMPKRAENELVDVGVIAAPPKLFVPLSADAQREYAEYAGLRCAVTLVPRSLIAELSKEEQQTVHAAPIGPFVYGKKLYGLDAEQAKRCAGGEPFDCAMRLLASDELCDRIRAAKVREARRAMLQDAANKGEGELAMLAAVHEDQLTKTHGLAAQMISEERIVAAGCSEADGASSGDDDDDEQQPQRQRRSTEAATSNRSAAGRSGRWWSHSGFLRNPTWRMATSKSELHAHHAFAIAPNEGTLDRVSLAYVSDEHAEPLTRRRAETQPSATLKGDRRPSLPRTFTETPGRHYLHLSHLQHQRLQAEGSASAARAQAVAESRVQVLLFLGWLGLAPMPPQPKDQPSGPPRTRQSQAEAQQPAASDMAAKDVAARQRASRCSERQTHAKGAPRTAWRTWQVFDKSASQEDAIAALACLKGFYLNFYPAPMHKDSDDYLESWSIRKLLDLDSAPFESAEPLDQAARPPGHEANAGATILPLRGLALFTRPERDVTHAFFKSELHGAWDCGADAKGGGRGGAGGAPTAFHLQSGGCSDRRIEKVMRWVKGRMRSRV